MRELDEPRLNQIDKEVRYLEPCFYSLRRGKISPEGLVRQNLVTRAVEKMKELSVYTLFIKYWISRAGDAVLAVRSLVSTLGLVCPVPRAGEILAFGS